MMSELRRERAVRFSYQCGGPAPTAPPSAMAAMSLGARRQGILQVLPVEKLLVGDFGGTFERNREVVVAGPDAFEIRIAPRRSRRRPFAFLGGPDAPCWCAAGSWQHCGAGQRWSSTPARERACAVARSARGDCHGFRNHVGITSSGSSRGSGEAGRYETPMHVVSRLYPDLTGGNDASVHRRLCRLCAAGGGSAAECSCAIDASGREDE